MYVHKYLIRDGGRLQERFRQVSKTFKHPLSDVAEMRVCYWSTESPGSRWLLAYFRDGSGPRT
jgi:hypothetical protein